MQLVPLQLGVSVAMDRFDRGDGSFGGAVHVECRP
jgi:hypothetical protein